MNISKALEMTVPRIDDVVNELMETEEIPKGKINIHVFIQRYSDYFINYDPNTSDNYLLEEWVTRVAHGHESEVDIVDDYDNVLDTIPPIIAPKRDVKDMVFRGSGVNIASRLNREIRYNKDENAVQDMSVSLMDSYLDQRKINKNKKQWSYILNKYNNDYYQNYENNYSTMKKEKTKTYNKIEDIDIDYE